jgi:protein involved in polysaccharide export with SLBB domain
VPVRRVPPELLAPSKKDEQTIPLTLLGQCPPDTYRLAPGDVLGVYVEGFLGEPTQPVPIRVGPGLQPRDQRLVTPSMGYPVVVEGNGAIDLPGAGPLVVAGKSVPQARGAIRELYVRRGLLKPDTAPYMKVVVTLLEERRASVLVLRQEAIGFTAPGFTAAPGSELPSSKRGLGFQVDLPGYENDVLHALTRTGGLPGLDVYNEVVIQRACFRDEAGRAALLRDLGGVRAGVNPLAALGRSGPVVRIPLRAPHGQAPCLKPEDVVLHNGDVVFLEARADPYFYTGGLLPPGAYVLPRDRDLDVLAALAQVRGPLFNGDFGGSNLSGDLVKPGIGNPSATLLVVLRRTPGGGQVPIRVDLARALCDPRERILVQEGDVLLLQEQPEEALSRWVTQTFFNFNLFWEVFHSRHAVGVIDASAPDRLPGRLELFSPPAP